MIQAAVLEARIPLAGPTGWGGGNSDCQADRNPFSVYTASHTYSNPWSLRACKSSPIAAMPDRVVLLQGPAIISQDFVQELIIEQCKAGHLTVRGKTLEVLSLRQSSLLNLQLSCPRLRSLSLDGAAFAFSLTS